MIPRLRGAITHGPDTKLLGEDGEDAATDWGARPCPEAKPFGKDPGDTLTHGRGNKPNPKKDPTGIKVQGWHYNRLRKGGNAQCILMPSKTKLIRGTSEDQHKRSPISLNAGGGAT